MTPGQEKRPEAKRQIAFRPRERRLALIAGVVIGCWLLVSWIVQPLWDRARDLRAHVESQTEKLDALNHLLAQAAVIEQEHQQIAGYLTREEEEQSQSAFLNELEALARGSGLQLSSKLRSVKPEERFSRFEVELDVEGAQERLLTFLDGLLGMPKLIAIDRLRLSSVPANEHALRANLILQKLTLR